MGGDGDVGSARYEPALLPPCPTIRVLSYSSYIVNFQKFSTLRVNKQVAANLARIPAGHIPETENGDHFVFMGVFFSKLIRLRKHIHVFTHIVSFMKICQVAFELFAQANFALSPPDGLFIQKQI